MKIYAIIVTYNAMRRNWADRCLKSLQSSTVPVTPVVVDNGSIDGTCEFISAQYPDAVLFPQNRNLGFGQANNVGIRYAMEQKADYVLLLNQDAAILPDTLKLLLAESDGLTMMTPVHCNGDGSAFDHNFKNFSLSVVSDLPQTLEECKQTKGRHEIGEICAACWLMPSHVIKTIGGFNPLFFQYSEDNNYYHRLQYHHVKTYLVPAARMFHDRQTYGNAKVYHKQLLRRRLLLVLCNINLSPARRLKETLYLLADCYKTWLPQRAYIPGTFSYEMLCLISLMPKIRLSRKVERQQGMTWLNPKTC